MKKKIIFGVTVCLFVLATMFSLNMSQQSNISNISLKNIAALSTANAEGIRSDCGIGWHGPFCGYAIIDDYYWQPIYYCYVCY